MFENIWSSINQLEFETEPNYALILNLLKQAQIDGSIQETDLYDWSLLLAQYENAISKEFEGRLTVHNISFPQNELGIPPHIQMYTENPNPATFHRDQHFLPSSVSQELIKPSKCCC